ncbi:MAG: hypothetical protein KGL48_05510 [Sphingomonadales bacterium]|nr:hypothetical protein [Sphingomonadales bacterium]MDE2568669.1 hypothetical protein [Sphingomonadales bacterium]
MGAIDGQSGGGLTDWLGAALDWWREAGVDHDYHDDAQDWLAAARIQHADRHDPAASAAEPAATRRETAAPPAIGGARGAWPASLDDFGAWWLTEPSLSVAPASRRVPPSGPQGAPLMVFVPMPEEGDGKVLLAGAQGRLLDAMLSAMGLSRDRVYLASALPARIAAPDWRALHTAGLAAVIAHHVALAAPERLLVLGRSDVSPLLGHDPAKSAPFEPVVNHEVLKVAAFADYGLDAMLARPALKAGVWSRWLRWTG